ncbi:MAG: hypothetical protein IT271_12265 [Chitinophagales bacterium]|nr:hypothetical protein [Chitinophagales bacterium]
MKRIVFLLLTFLSSSIYAADFMHDIGVGFWSKLRNTNNAEPTSYGPFAQYMPRCNFKIKENMSVSLASPIAIGARFHPTQGNYFQLQLPATVLYNIGHAAFKKEKLNGNVGGYIGTGFNYILSASETLRESDFGLISLAGLRFYTHHHSLGLQVSYTHDFRFKNNFIGAGFFYTFGYFE